MWNGIGAPIVCPGHGFGCDHCIDDGLFGGFNSSSKKGLHCSRRKPHDRRRRRRGQTTPTVAPISSTVGRGECDKDVARAVAMNRPHSPQAKAHATSQALELVWRERSVGGYHDDDRTLLQLFL